MLAVEVLGYDVFSASIGGAPHKAASELQTSGFHAAQVAPKTNVSSTCELEERSELFFPELVRALHRLSCQAGDAMSGCLCLRPRLISRWFADLSGHFNLTY